MGVIVCDIITLQSTLILVESAPIIGVTGLTGFTEDLIGVTGSEFFTSKQFAYSKDGINWSDYIPLTNDNITSLSFLTTDVILIECAYQKNTSDPALAVVNITFDTTTAPVGFDDTYFNNSIFAEFFDSDNVDVLNWYINVVQKLYKKDTLLPKYINVIGVDGTDKDFIAFWSSIAKFFAFEVIYARTYQNFYTVTSLLQEFLEERGMKTSSQDTLTQLQYLLYHYSHQVYNRGTIHIVDDTINGAPVNGELRRLLWYEETDEFLFNLHELHHFGWNLGNSSPCWRGLYLNKGLNKVTESSQQVKV